MSGRKRKDRMNGFKGGIHPHYSKEKTERLPILDAKMPERVVIPLAQHIGAPCEPIVKIGEEVKKGQKIGEAKGFVSAPVHSSVSGKVTAIGKFPHPSGRDVLSIVIESDGKDEWVDGLIARPDYLKLPPEELKKIIHEAGIVGLGGATFPTHVKLTPPPEKKIRIIILNGAECEPYLTADHRLMVEKPEEIVEGLRILMRILNVQYGYIGVETNKADAVSRLTEIVAKIPKERLAETYVERSGIEWTKEVDAGPNIKIIPLDVKYPQGAEKQLIKAILNREVPSGGLPMDVGVVVQNVGTACAISEAARFGRPLIDRVTTITGAVMYPKNLRVRIGTLFSALIEECGGFSEEPAKIVMGGPMMGIAQHTLNVPVIKGTSGIVILPKAAAGEKDFYDCIRCGMCVRACPMGLLPNMLGIYGELRLVEKGEEFRPMDCIECGCCSFVCPSKRPLVHFIRYLKNELSIKRSRAKEKKEAVTV